MSWVTSSSRTQPARAGDPALRDSPRREPWERQTTLSPVPSPACAGEGRRRRGEGHSTQGSLPGLRIFAPNGACIMVVGLSIYLINS